MLELTKKGTYNGLTGFWVKEINGTESFISWQDDGYNAIVKLNYIEDLEKAGRLYIMSEKLASHVKDVIGKAEYEAMLEAETKHGMWMQDLDDIVCSECKTYWNVFDDCTETFKYCPNCGAKMAEGKKE